MNLENKLVIYLLLVQFYLGYQNFSRFPFHDSTTTIGSDRSEITYAQALADNLLTISINYVVRFNVHIRLKLFVKKLSQKGIDLCW